ncbi:hypothetical protein KSP40_PGU001667 [Platanthera guangdongensis]|uniref:Uncharacterized protein n=1 Tax=Platanthera guangdongensis TaxID=2320717 RepID=A0ABR2LYN0_9ASPA
MTAVKRKFNGPDYSFSKQAIKNQMAKKFSAIYILLSRRPSPCLALLSCPSFAHSDTSRNSSLLPPFSQSIVHGGADKVPGIPSRTSSITPRRGNLPPSFSRSAGIPNGRGLIYCRLGNHLTFGPTPPRRRSMQNVGMGLKLLSTLFNFT